MLKTQTCQTCLYFEKIHSMCTKQRITDRLGTTFAIRTADSPACWFDYFRKPQPGELEALFRKMKIERPEESVAVIETVEAFSFKTSVAL